MKIEKKPLVQKRARAKREYHHIKSELRFGMHHFVSKHGLLHIHHKPSSSTQRSNICNSSKCKITTICTSKERGRLIMKLRVYCIGVLKIMQR